MFCMKVSGWFYFFKLLKLLIF